MIFYIRVLAKLMHTTLAYFILFYFFFMNNKLEENVK